MPLPLLAAEQAQDTFLGRETLAPPVLSTQRMILHLVHDWHVTIYANHFQLLLFSTRFMCVLCGSNNVSPRDCRHHSVHKNCVFR